MILNKSVRTPVSMTIAAVIAGVLLLARPCMSDQGFFQIVMSSGAPIGTSQSFLAATTAQWQANVVTIPFYPNTYDVTIFGQNPAYVAPVFPSNWFVVKIATDTQTVFQSTTALNDVYYNGWRDGADNDSQSNISLLQYMQPLCASATNFYLVNTTTATFDAKTCMDTAQTFINQLFNLTLSTPTEIPPEF